MPEHIFAQNGGFCFYIYLIMYTVATSQFKQSTKNGTILLKKIYHMFILQCDYSNQGHPIKFSTNLTNKQRGGLQQFPTNYPCNQAVHYKGNRIVVILDNLLENYR